jgi:amino acid transporter
MSREDIMERHYRALRVTARIFQVVGIIIAILTIIAIILSCIAFAVGARNYRFDRNFYWEWPPNVGARAAAVIGGIAAFIYGGITALVLYAIGEAIFVVLAIEENTRATAQQLRREETPPPAAPPAQIQPAEDR